MILPQRNGVPMMKLFVGFDFSDTSLLAKKITGFRKRFDPKFKTYAFPHMAMLAPFESLDYQVEDLTDILKEELETFFYGQNETPKLGFTGVGVHAQKRKQIVYLNPHYDTDLEHCLEFVQDLCRACMAPNIKYKANKKQFLPLGYFQTETEMQVVTDQARMEFASYGEIPIESISLYEKRPQGWIKRETLIQFESNQAHFLQLNNHSL